MQRESIQRYLTPNWRVMRIASWKERGRDDMSTPARKVESVSFFRSGISVTPPQQWLRQQYFGRFL